VTVFAPQYGTVTHVKMKSRSVSYGQCVTFSVSVQSTSAFSGAPIGTLLLIYEADEFGNLQLRSGKATFTTASLPAGHDSVYVYYEGNPTFSYSISNTLVETVAQERTRTNVVSSRNPSSFGQAITLTVRVSPATTGGAIPTGSVTVSEGLGTVTLSGGNASLTTSLLSVGTHRIRVHYNGGVDFRASSSPVLRQRIKQSPPTALRLFDLRILGS
jgi:Bacterial Ig-like domain (group 3)